MSKIEPLFCSRKGAKNRHLDYNAEQLIQSSIYTYIENVDLVLSTKTSIPGKANAKGTTLDTSLFNYWPLRIIIPSRTQQKQVTHKVEK